jgi:hypothetical protein
MTVTNVLLGEYTFDLNKDKEAEFSKKLNPDLSKLFAQNVAINSSALVLEQDGKRVVSGSASEIGIILLLRLLRLLLRFLLLRF